MIFKASPSDLSEDDEEIAYLTRRFHKIVKQHGGYLKKGNSSRSANANDLCNKCGKSGHFIRYCPVHKLEYKDYIKSEETKKSVGVRSLTKKEESVIADQVVKKALAARGNSSSDLEESEHPEDVSMLVVKGDEYIFDSLFSLMAKSYDEDIKEEVCG
ncbi:uncharacterized protein [Solanum tuberosum]|uniref:uncharacterized protein n=1 Tax=Solanum tuberosum TaxID=4113 RepID=UPI00073A362F|nr:PREDICTED: uncharacterized protein LOC107062434 [Solanum tuberosum]